MDMENKKYKNNIEITRALRQLVQRRMCSGESFLPSERQLSSMFAASRATLRKAIGALKDDGLLVREGRHTRLVRPFHDFTDCGRILFLAAGAHSAFQQSAIERLWNALRTALLANHGDVQLLLTEPDTTFDRISAHLAAADTVLFANCSGSCANEAVAMLRSNLRSKHVISLIESEVFDFPNLIALDNYAVGAIAAEALLEAGCRKPFALWCICDNRDFAHRAQGFANKLAAHNQGGIQSVFWVPQQDGNFSEAGHRQIDWAIRHGYDGVFLMSDEYLDEMTDRTFAAGLIPDKFKVITVDATRASFRHHPPVSCVSHATAEMVFEITGQLRLIAEGRFRPVRKLVRPTVYNNGTL